MDKKFYRSGIAKFLYVIFFIASVMLATFSLRWFGKYTHDIGSGFELIFGDKADKWEDTKGFERIFEGDMKDQIEKLKSVDMFYKNDKLDKDKIVDIANYAKSNVISEKSVYGLSYRLGDLLESAEKLEGELDEVSNVYYENEKAEGYYTRQIYILRKTDGRYIYKSAEQFGELCEKNNVDANDIFDQVGKWYSEYDDEYYEYREQYEEESEDEEDEGYRKLLVDENDVKYDDVRCIIVPNMTVDALEGSFEDIFNNNNYLNGRMSTYMNYLVETMESLLNRQRLINEVEQDKSQTNFRYYIKRTAKSDWVTNDIDMAKKGTDELVKAVTGNGRYVIIETDKNVETDIDIEKPVGIDRIMGDGGIAIFTVDKEYTVKDEYSTAYKIYDSYMKDLGYMRVMLYASMVAFMLSLLMMTITAGRDEYGKLELNTFDNIMTEIAACGVITVWGIDFGIVACVIEEFGESTILNNSPFIEITFALPTAILFVIGYTSLVRRIKGRTLWKNSVVYYIYSTVKKWIKSFVDTMFDGNRPIALLAAYGVAFVVFIVLLQGEEGLAVLYAFVIGAFQYIKSVKKESAERKLVDAAQNLVDGNFEDKIDISSMPELEKKIAISMNNVQNGMKEAVAERMKSEHLKTELITNVSHDIKTPLTAIINYVDLLKTETEDIKKADQDKIREYFEVLEQRTSRLKVLAEDVIEASKISSGNISLENVELDLLEMLTQIEGEYSEKFESADLKIVHEIGSEPLHIYADGRRVWRVLGNLYQNVAKYALPGSRVYVKLDKDTESVMFIMKNISCEELNISAEELTERFIRGDKSRNTEGSGLGLSIAKSLTEAMGGTFDIYIDGDLFKVSIRFKNAEYV